MMYLKRKHISIFLLLFVLIFSGCKKTQIDEGENVRNIVTSRPTESAVLTETPKTTVTSEPTVISTPTAIPEPIEVPVSTVTEEPIQNIEHSKEYIRAEMVERGLPKVEKMVSEGIITGFANGESKFLVWKSEAMGINSTKNYKFAIVDYKGNFEKNFFMYDFELSDGIVGIKHMGSNIFQIATVDGNAMYHNIEKDNIFSFFVKGMMYEFLEGFSDGYAVITSRYPSYKEKGYPYYGLLLLSDTGMCINTNIYVKELYGRGAVIGKYGNGVFFYNDAFYNSSGAMVLDLSDVYVENEPYFEGDYCWIEYHDFEFVWGAWMDINGNFKEEPQKLYELNWD